MTEIIDIRILRQDVCSELPYRRIDEAAGVYSQIRGGRAELYGTTAVVNIRAILGMPFSSASQRRKWAAAILGYQREDGIFVPEGKGFGPGHALIMVLQALNLLCEPIPSNAGPLAPLDPSELSLWLKGHDWKSTHKELCGSAMPLLADGAVSSEWIRVFTREISSRLSAERPLETWCAADAPPWQVISCIYHVLESYDAGCISYPEPDLLLDRLLKLGWPDRRKAEQQTECTDGDWAWLLIELCKLRHERYVKAMQQIRSVSVQRAGEWNGGKIKLSEMTTHGIYCFLWVTALFQHQTRDLFSGPWMYDTLNDPTLFRLGRNIIGQ
ncbi:MAG TPA: hypothetical protein DCZ94_15730 [Lentisphaeria bacterium]|nr:MAG: hypothetical protein A2X48_16885 [Lentisphaerae bacterium GWF2_49_21]HBC88399.1 hypothetical protein [Lentisphaeria bacterium]